VKNYVLSEERRRLQNEAVRLVIESIQGPVGFYEHWPGQKPQLTITKEARAHWRNFCRLVGNTETGTQKCRQDYEKRAADCTGAQVDLCWAGVHNAACAVKDGNGGRVIVLGGEFLVRQQVARAEQKLNQFLQTIPLEQRVLFYEAWRRIPQINQVTVQNQILRELQLAGQQYLHSVRQISQFRYSVESVSHDLVILLQGLIGSTEVLQIELEHTFGIGKKWVARFEDIIQKCERFHAYLEARLGSLGEPDYRYEPLAKVVYECVDLYQAKAAKRGIDIQVDLQTIEDEEGKTRVPSLKMAHAYLNRAFHNIMDNAVKYSFDGTAAHPRWVEITGRVQARRGIPGYALEVSNLGIGIEADEITRVFEPGYQGRRRLGEFRPGFGMGLTFVKECIEMHGGTVSIHSEPMRRTGWLTTLNMWLPIHGPAVDEGE
jgi:signal transduction histidine kinase